MARTAADRADDAGRRPVGPGRLLRRAGRLQGAQDQGQTTLVSLVIGPWRHSGVNHYGYDLGALTFTGDTADGVPREVHEAVLRSLPEGRAGSAHAARC